MAIGFSALTIVLEEGFHEEWFSSPMIVGLSTVAAISIIGVRRAEFVVKNPLLDLRLLRRRSVIAGSVLMFTQGAICFGAIFLLPFYLAQVPRYSALQIGARVVMWSGLPATSDLPFIASHHEPIRRAYRAALAWACWHSDALRTPT